MYLCVFYEKSSTVFHAGFIDMMKALNEIGLIDPNPHTSLHPQGPEITWVILIANEFHSKVKVLEITQKYYSCRENLFAH